MEDPLEMHQPLPEAVNKLQQTALYPLMFQKAFGSPTITKETRLKALAQFQRTIISGYSRYDRYVRKEPGGALSSLELEGMTLFKANCGSCHATDFFTDNGFHNKGLNDTFPEDNEQLAYGRGRISRSAQDIGKFKTPTLRNIALTAPYIHDGRLNTLDDVLAHYATGGSNLLPWLHNCGKTAN